MATATAKKTPAKKAAPAAAKKATSSAGQTAVKKTVGSAAKAVGADVAGGGPENPVADIVAIKQATKGSSPAPKVRAAKKPARSKKSRAVAWAWSGSRKLLVAEFILVIFIVGVGTLTTTGSVKDELPKAMIKASALAAIFFIAAIIAGSGNKSAKVVTALTTLITAAYVFTSPEAHSAVSFIGAYFAPKKNQAKKEG